MQARKKEKGEKEQKRKKAFTNHYNEQKAIVG